MTAAKTPAERRPARAGERFTVLVLAAIAAVLGYVYFFLLPRQENPPPPAFAFENPMLDARPGERVLLFKRSRPHARTCSVVRPEGVVLRPHRGPAQIGEFENLRRALPYLPCTFHEERGGAAPCEGKVAGEVLYALNYFGMPHDTNVRVVQIRPRTMRWSERELTVYEVIFERHDALGGQWTTYVSVDAPVAGLVKYSYLLPAHEEVHYREILNAGQ
jgi:hypothetical protein